MNKLKNIFITILLFYFIYILFKYSNILNTSVINAVNLWINKVFPSLFIMFILNDIIINTNILQNVISFINPFFNKIFNTNGSSCEAFILSIFSGTPSAAFIIKEMLNNNKISLNDANKLLSFTYFSNPLFLYNILNLTFNNYISLKIILFHYLSNIPIGLIFRKSKNNNIILNNEKVVNKNIFNILSNAITKSLNTLLMILGTITFYMIITNILINITNWPLNLEIIVKGLFEITQSLNVLNTLNSSSIIKEIIAISIISFGGLSIHTQVLTLINDTKISYKNFFIGRILHLLISTNTYLFFSLCISR